MAAIAYYVAGLIGYVAKGTADAGLAIDPELMVGASVPLVVVVLYLGLRRMRRRLHRVD